MLSISTDSVSPGCKHFKHQSQAPALGLLGKCLGKCPGTPHHAPWAEEVARTEASLSHIFTWKSVLNQTSVMYHSPFCLMGSSFSSLLWLQIPREMLLATFPLPTSSVLTTSAEVIFFQSSQFHGGAQKKLQSVIFRLSAKVKHKTRVSAPRDPRAGVCWRHCQVWCLCMGGALPTQHKQLFALKA